MAIDRRFIVTDGPRAGKTALLAALAARGHLHVPESARAIIRDRRDRGLAFAEAVRVHATPCEWYRRCGELVEVLPASVKERCDAVLRNIREMSSIESLQCGSHPN